MAIRTVTGGTASVYDFTPGWKELTIKNAKYGTYGDNKYLDVWFEDYPDNLNARAYEAINKKTKEEFRIANWFKFANAGIQEVIRGENSHPVITYDDDPANLVGTTINVFLYNEEKSGNEYLRMWREPAPTVMDTDMMSYSENDVVYWKGRAEKSYHNYRTRVQNGSSNNDVFNSAKTESTTTNEVPF